LGGLIIGILENLAGIYIDPLVGGGAKAVAPFLILVAILMIRRGLMSSPKLMLLDEPSMGLSPLLVAEIFRIIQQIDKEEGVSILLVEQNARLALSIADHGYVMENGLIVLDDTVEKLRENADVREFYLGLSDVGGKKSYRDVKHYKRRKRWLT
jgi:branched-chain amino acid transport system ATP-binding protein